VRKQKTCKICKNKFAPIRDLQPTCSEYECMLEYANKTLKAKTKEKKVIAHREKKKLLESDIQHLKKVAQKIFNEFIRLRDSGLPCISCGKIIGQTETSHCSHYRPATNSRLRYDEKNCWRSCVKCNVFLSSNAIKYREALIEKLGLEVVEELDNTNGIYRYTPEELLEIISIYKLKVKELKCKH